ncbi:MAG: hypothetical protein ACYC6K_13210 [Bellilinea sp.]
MTSKKVILVSLFFALALSGCTGAIDTQVTSTPEPTVTETPIPPKIEEPLYPISSENFIKTPGVSGAEARKRIIELGAGKDLAALESWYKTAKITGTGISNFTVPVIYESGGEVYWNLMAKNNSGNFLKFTITSGKETNQTVRAMGMVTYLESEPSFTASELADPRGMDGAVTQQIIWDKSGWSVVGAFQGSNLVAWFNADAPNGGVWVKLQEIVPTVKSTKTPEAPEYFNYGSSIDPKRLAEVEALYYPNSDYSMNFSESLKFPLVGVAGYPIAYNFEKDENGTQLFVLFATPGGLVKTEVKVFNFSDSWPTTMYEVSLVDAKEAEEISSALDGVIKQMNESGRSIEPNGYIILVSINTKADARACLVNHRGIKNAEQLCTYDASNVTLTPQQMLDKIESSVITTRGKTPEEALDLESYPALSSEGNMYVRLQL